MTHEYSVSVHDYLSLKIKSIQKKLNKIENHNNADFRQSCNGQLDELFRIRKLLTEKIDLDTYKYYD